MTFRARDQIKINQKRKYFMLVGEDEHRRKRKSLLKEVFVEVLRHVKNPSLKVNIEIHRNVFFLWPGS